MNTFLVWLCYFQISRRSMRQKKKIRKKIMQKICSVCAMQRSMQNVFWKLFFTADKRGNDDATDRQTNDRRMCLLEKPGRAHAPNESVPAVGFQSTSYAAIRLSDSRQCWLKSGNAMRESTVPHNNAWVLVIFISETSSYSLSSELNSVRAASHSIIIIIVFFVFAIKALVSDTSSCWRMKLVDQWTFWAEHPVMFDSNHNNVKTFRQTVALRLFQAGCLRPYELCNLGQSRTIL